MKSLTIAQQSKFKPNMFNNKNNKHQGNVSNIKISSLNTKRITSFVKRPDNSLKILRKFKKKGLVYKLPECVVLMNPTNNPFVVNECFKVFLPIIGPVSGGDLNFYKYMYPIPADSSNFGTLRFLIYLFSITSLLSLYKNRNSFYKNLIEGPKNIFQKSFRQKVHK